MRAELKRLERTGENLRTWRRRLILDPSLHPCRRTVVSDPYTRTRAGGGWTQQRGALLTESARQANARTITSLVRGLRFHADTTYLSKETAQKHEVAESVDMQRIIDALVEYRFEDPRDTAAFTGLLVTIGEAFRRDPALTAAVYKMRPEASGRRDINANGTIENFLQGRTDRPGGYPGDTFFQKPDRLSVQLHSYDLRISKKVVATAAPLIVFYVPPNLARDWLIQVQAGQ
jgi:hypothetical protein